ncbi:cytosolic 5'-nucleotidase 1A-like [Embiotoca jacksoni]|uniref:cytosolic 5'-nucleotidase 1A-like n=1 Tax=Embiotoca jacksoni TaxID=100190 RepID=UPI003704C153
MSFNDKKRCWSPGQDSPTNTRTGGKKQNKPEIEIPVTIAMPIKVLFKEELGSSSASPGPAFSFVKALKAVNAELLELYPESRELFKVIIIDEHPTGSINSTIQTHGLNELITFLSVSEDQLVHKLQQHNTHLYLSDESQLKVKEALNEGIAAAAVFTPDNIAETEDQLRVAFDGDAVLFSDESERVFKDKGLKGYLENEMREIENPMKPGPFKTFLEVLERLQRKFHDKPEYKKKCPIRTYLVTSRGAGCDGYRALNTLRTWSLEMDEAVFNGGSKKGPPLQRIKPQIFFDDQMSHVEAALEVGIVACLVPFSSE